MLKRMISILFAVLVLLSITAIAQTRKPALLKFADLQHYSPANETFRIEGYVFNIYKCPPCPRGAMCKPCIPNNITLVDTANWKDMSTLKQLRIYTDLTDKFKLKSRYRLTVKVNGSVLEGAAIDSVDLVSIEPIARH